MKTIQLFNIAPAYESPRIKTVKLSPRAHYLQQVSNNYDSIWHTETYGVDEEEDI